MVEEKLFPEQTCTLYSVWEILAITFYIFHSTLPFKIWKEIIKSELALLNRVDKMVVFWRRVLAKIIIFSFSGNFGRLKIKFGDRPLNFGGSLQIDLTVGNRNHPMVRYPTQKNVVIYQGELILWAVIGQITRQRKGGVVIITRERWGRKGCKGYITIQERAHDMS